MASQITSEINMLTILSLALFGAASESRLGLSRVAAPSVGRANELRSLVDEIARLRGGGSQTCDVVLVGCGVPKRGMGWYHGVQMLDGDVPSATMTAVVEPWFLGQGADSPPGKVFGEWATEMEAKHGTKFVKDVSELEIKVRHLAIAPHSSAGYHRAQSYGPARSADPVPPGRGLRSGPARSPMASGMALGTVHRAAPAGPGAMFAQPVRHPLHTWRPPAPSRPSRAPSRPSRAPSLHRARPPPACPSPPFRA